MGNGTAPNPYAPLGLPATWAPIQPGWAIGKIDMQTDLGARTAHVLMFDSPIGRIGFAFDVATWGNIARAMYEQLSGLSLAHPAQVPKADGSDRPW